MKRHSPEEEEAAEAVAGLKIRPFSVTAATEQSKEMEYSPRVGPGGRANKVIKRTVTDSPSSSDREWSSAAGSDDDESYSGGRACLPRPFYYYRDHSRDVDDEPGTPLTPPSRAPNFPAKMHAILGRTELEDIVAWLPHGRSWRVLDSKAFERRVLPEYFDHRKFSSFIRQANGWGFRRITTGCDRNTYYHELFLRGMPYLCKKMKRPGIAKKVAGDPDREPNFYEISKLHPVPEVLLDGKPAMSLSLATTPAASQGAASLTSPAVASASSQIPAFGASIPSAAPSPVTVTPPETGSTSPHLRSAAITALAPALPSAAQQIEVAQQQAQLRQQEVAAQEHPAVQQIVEAVAQHTAAQQQKAVQTPAVAPHVDLQRLLQAAQPQAPPPVNLSQQALQAAQLQAPPQAALPQIDLQQVLRVLQQQQAAPQPAAMAPTPQVDLHRAARAALAAHQEHSARAAAAQRAARQLLAAQRQQQEAAAALARALQPPPPAQQLPLALSPSAAQPVAIAALAQALQQRQPQLSSAPAPPLGSPAPAPLPAAAAPPPAGSAPAPSAGSLMGFGRLGFGL